MNLSRTNRADFDPAAAGACFWRRPRLRTRTNRGGASIVGAACAARQCGAHGPSRTKCRRPANRQGADRAASQSRDRFQSRDHDRRMATRLGAGRWRIGAAAVALYRAQSAARRPAAHSLRCRRRLRQNPAAARCRPRSNQVARGSACRRSATGARTGGAQPRRAELPFRASFGGGGDRQFDQFAHRQSARQNPGHPPQELHHRIAPADPRPLRLRHLGERAAVRGRCRASRSRPGRGVVGRRTESQRAYPHRARSLVDLPRPLRGKLARHPPAAALERRRRTALLAAGLFCRRRYPFAHAAGRGSGILICDDRRRADLARTSELAVLSDRAVDRHRFHGRRAGHDRACAARAAMATGGRLRLSRGPHLRARAAACDRLRPDQLVVWRHPPHSGAVCADHRGRTPLEPADRRHRGRAAAHDRRRRWRGRAVAPVARGPRGGLDDRCGHRGLRADRLPAASAVSGATAHCHRIDPGARLSAAALGRRLRARARR